MATLKTEKLKRGKQKFGDGEPVGRALLGLRLLVPHGLLRGAGERSEGGLVLNSLWETRRGKSGQEGKDQASAGI